MCIKQYNPDLTICSNKVLNHDKKEATVCLMVFNFNEE